MAARRIARSVVAATLAAAMVPLGAAAGAGASTDPLGFTTVHYPAGALPTSVALGDLNEDGALDVAAVATFSNGGPGRGTVLLGDGSGGFTSGAGFVGIGETIDVALVDVDGDGHLDAVSVGFIPDALMVEHGDGHGAFGLPIIVAVGDESRTLEPNSVAAGDLDDDGDVDLVTADQGGAVSVLHNDGIGGFGPSIEIDVGGNPWAVALERLDADDALDLIVTNGATNVVSVFRGTGTGTFTGRIDYSTGVQPHGVTIGDFDGDGHPDLATANRGSSTVSVRLGTGAGTFGSRTDYPAGSGSFDVVNGDVDGDGVLDLAVAAPDLNAATVLLGVGDGSFGAPTAFAAGREPRAIAADDLNGDGDLDLVTADFSADTVTVLINGFHPTAPGAPTIQRNATASNGSATVSWIAPVTTGGSPIIGYVVTPYVRYSPRPSTYFDSTATTQQVTGLVNGTQYRFRVQAVNAVGTSGFSTVTNPVVPAPTAPDPPTILRNATAGDGVATVSWLAPATDGGSPILGYVVTPYVGYSPRPSTYFDSTATTQQVTGLVNGTQYRFRVQAVNAVGTSGFSTVTNPVVPTT